MQRAVRQYLDGVTARTLYNSVECLWACGAKHRQNQLIGNRLWTTEVTDCVSSTTA